MRVIIIGGVAAGMSAAAKLKRLQPETEVVVYEKTDIVSFGACGLPYFVGGFFDDEKNMIARSPEKFRESGIELFTNHEVLEVDFDKKIVKIKDLENNKEFTDSYDKLMIATGASAIIPPIENVNNLENVHTLKSMYDGTKIKEILSNEKINKVSIIGAGFIGLETVEAMKNLGKEVTLIQMGDRVLQEVFDKEITDLLEKELRSHGVELHLNTTVTKFLGDKKVKKVVTDKEEIDTDLVIIATGVRPNTRFLQNTNIKMLKNGAIIVDEYGKTSVDCVYSAGDCATVKNKITGEDSYIPLATTANKLGRIVGENLAGENNSYQGSLSSSCIKVINMESARVGLSEEECIRKNINYKAKFISDMNQTNYYPGREKIYVKLIYNKETKVIIGGQVCCYKDAVQRANVLACAIFNQMTTEQLGMLDLCYAPPFARTWDVLNVAGNVCK